MVKNGLQRTDLLWDFAYKEQTWFFDVFTPLPPVEVPLKSKLDNSIGFEFPMTENPPSIKNDRKIKVGTDYCRLKQTCDHKLQICHTNHSAMEFCSGGVQYGTRFTRLDELSRMALLVFKISNFLPIFAKNRRVSSMAWRPADDLFWSLESHR